MKSLIYTLFTSVFLSVLLLLIFHDLFAALNQDTAILIQFSLILLCGYHRTIVTKAGSVRWWKLSYPQKDKIFIRNTLWGIPISRIRLVRISQETQEQVQNGSFLPTLRLLLPTWLRWFGSLR